MLGDIDVLNSAESSGVGGLWRCEMRFRPVSGVGDISLCTCMFFTTGSPVDLRKHSVISIIINKRPWGHSAVSLAVVDFPEVLSMHPNCKDINISLEIKHVIVQ